MALTATTPILDTGKLLGDSFATTPHTATVGHPLSKTLHASTCHYFLLGDLRTEPRFPFLLPVLNTNDLKAIIASYCFAWLIGESAA
jgi:hypothetical protein